MLCGENEDLMNWLMMFEWQQKEYYQDFDMWFKKFELQQVMIDGVEGIVQLGEMDVFSVVQQQFCNGNFKVVVVLFCVFIVKYLQSFYQLIVQYWYGNV